MLVLERQRDAEEAQDPSEQLEDGNEAETGRQSEHLHLPGVRQTGLWQ